MTPREVALDYIARGWAPIPVPIRSKAPTVEDWPHLVVTADNVDRYFRGELNVGVLCGEPSHWLVDIDLDTPEALELAPEFLPKTLTFGRPGRPRSHLLYTAPGAQTAKFIDPASGATLLELRSTGTQTLFPPSIHPSGEQSTFDNSTADDPPSEIEAKQLRRNVQRLACATLLRRHGYDRPGACELARRWEPGCDDGLPDAVAARARAWATGLDVAPAPPSRPAIVAAADAPSPVRRAAAYLARMPGAVSGSGGHQATWHAAVALVRGFALAESDALGLLLSDYNPRCSPPWSERELDHKVHDAAVHGRLPIGYLLNDPQRDWRRYQTPAPKVPQRSPEPAVLPTAQIAEVPDDAPAAWLVDDLWTEQAVGIVGGEPKSFKSFLTAQLAVCVAAGVPVMNRYATHQGTVLMYNAEDRPGMTKRRIFEMCRALEIDPAAIPLRLITTPSLRLDDDVQVDALAATVATVAPALLILDPLRNLHAADENDAQIVTGLLNPLRLIQREHGCSVMLVHHMAKLSEIHRRPGQRLRGSSALHGWVDSALYLERQDGADSVTVTAEHRAAHAPQPFGFRLVCQEVVAGPAMWLELAEGSRKRKSAEDVMPAVLDALEVASGPMSGEELRKAIGGKGILVTAAIKELVRQQLIERVDFGGDDGRKTGWRKIEK